jgi:hypothetical protein
MLYAPKNEDVRKNIEHKKHEDREESYAGEEGLSLRICGPWKCCSPPKEVARSPPDDSALRMHVALRPWAAARSPARRDHRPGVAERDEEELDAGGRTRKE